MSHPALFKPGDRLEHYVVEREIGRGGMGCVYLAKDKYRHVAIKVLLPDLLDDEGEARFDREISNLIRLEEIRGIPVVYHWGTRPCPFVAMKYLEGRNLDAYAKELQGATEPDRLARLGRLIAGVCRIVGAAHRKDIVHRDLKPANILVSSPNDEPFVLDFGIARCLRETRLTRGSQGPGTVPYQAPEQVDEELQRPGLESLIDVWAIGVVLYRTATRAYPFEAKGVFNVQKMILEAEPKSPRALNPDVPEALEDLVIDCLSKNPARRPATMDEVADRLRAIFPTTSASSSSSSSSAARRRGKTNVEAFAPPPWFDVVAATPDPAVVKDAEARARIAATGRPWRVRDKASGVEFLLAPPGEFFRGSLPNEGEADERPARMVRVARAFYLSATPVTQVDYARVVGKNPSRNKGDDRLPVEQVSYQDAVAFCARVGARLPTEAEWEYACRAGSDAQRYGPSDEVGWYRDNAGGGTKPVGLKAANAFGFHDMLGDVYEWCADWYDAEEYRKRADGDVAGAGPERGERRVIRGGAWNFPETNMRAAARGRWRPERAEAFIGFRIARDP